MHILCAYTDQNLAQQRQKIAQACSPRSLLFVSLLMLCKKHGLPPSRLASLRSPREENNCVQEECALPRLLKKEVVVEEEKVDMDYGGDKGEAGCQSVGASPGGSTNFTPRSIMMSTCPLHSLSHAFRHSPTSACHSSTRQNCIFTYPHQLARCQMPDACSLLGVVRGMQILGHHSHVEGWLKMLALLLA